MLSRTITCFPTKQNLPPGYLTKKERDGSDEPASTITLTFTEIYTVKHILVCLVVFFLLWYFIVLLYWVLIYNEENNIECKTTESEGVSKPLTGAVYVCASVHKYDMSSPVEIN